MSTAAEEKLLVIRFKEGNHAAYKVLYQKYAPKLFAFSRKYIYDAEDAREIVQDVFLRLWEKRENVDESQSFSSYVIQAAKHRIFNGFRKKVNEQAYIDFITYGGSTEANFTDHEVDYRDVKLKAAEAIDALPEKRREIFKLSREEGLKNKEIAERLGISIKTVENQMGEALKTLRTALSDYQAIILLFLVDHIKF